MDQNQEAGFTMDRLTRQLFRLERLMDVIYAIVLWRAFTLLPRPEQANMTWGTLTEFLLSDRSNILIVFVALVLIIIYWSQNNLLFGNLERTDGKHTIISMVHIFCLLLFLYAIRLGSIFEGTSQARFFESLTASLVGLTAVGGWYYAVKKDLVSDKLTEGDAYQILDKVMPEPICALLTIPCAFIGPIVWEIAWLLVIPVAQIIKRIRKPKPAF